MAYDPCITVTYPDHGLGLLAEFHLCGCQVNEATLYGVFLTVVHVHVRPAHNLCVQYGNIETTYMYTTQHYSTLL